MVEVLIERLGHHGDGIAAGPVYVPRTLPGERVEGILDGDRLTAHRIVDPSPERRAPPCGHYRACGGCALQHVEDAFIERWKADAVRAALAAQGLDAPIRAVHTSPPGSRRRATFSARRTKKSALVGFHAPQSDIIHAVPGCLILRPALLRAMPLIEALTQAGASRAGVLRATVTETDTGLDIAVSGGKPLDLALRQAIGDVAGASDVARITWSDELVASRIAPSVSFDGLAVPLAPGAFLQATREGETALRAAVSQAVGDALRIVDLYSGSGTFALPLSRIAEVHAVESQGSALAALDAGWRGASGLRRITTERRDLVRQPLTADDLAGFDAAVIDPPRAGAETQANEIAASGLGRVASVSCNPGTFARDARRLVDAGFRIEWIDVVDQFRWSPHIELVAAFRRS